MQFKDYTGWSSVQKHSYMDCIHNKVQLYFALLKWVVTKQSTRWKIFTVLQLLVSFFLTFSHFEASGCVAVQTDDNLFRAG